jgi:hypothetical protein
MLALEPEVLGTEYCPYDVSLEPQHISFFSKRPRDRMLALEP